MDEMVEEEIIEDVGEEKPVKRKKAKSIEEEIAPTGELLVPLEKYLEAGIHIGSRFRSGNMKKFIYKYRNDGMCVLNINELDNRIRIAAKFLSRYEPEKILVVAGRNYAQKPAKKFAEMIGAKYVIGRFIPGTLTNPSNENFLEPHIIIAADPPIDKQVINEVITAKIPLISLCDTSNMTKNIDLVIPANNKGKRALAIIYWLLAREVLKEKGMIKSNEEFSATIDDFESTAVLRERVVEKPTFEKRGRRDTRRRKK